MDSPIYSENDGPNLLYTIYSRFFRIATKAGDILVEYGAKHIKPLIATQVPPAAMPNGGIPPGSICLDRYNDLKPSKRLPIPFGIQNDSDNANLLRAILAMKPADVSHMQNDDNGCGPAVVAYLTGQTYQEAVRNLFPSGNVRIFGTQRLAAATNTTRRNCKSGTWAEVERAKAVAALIKNTDPRLGRHYGHYVAIDPGMMIVDPELVLHYPLAEYPRRAWSVLMYFVRS